MFHGNGGVLPAAQHAGDLLVAVGLERMDGRGGTAPGRLLPD